MIVSVIVAKRLPRDTPMADTSAYHSDLGIPEPKLIEKEGTIKSVGAVRSRWELADSRNAASDAASDDFASTIWDKTGDVTGASGLTITENCNRAAVAVSVASSSAVNGALRNDQGREVVLCDQEEMLARVFHAFTEQRRDRQAHHAAGFVDVAWRVPSGHRKDARRRQMIEEGVPSLDRVEAVLG